MSSELAADDLYNDAVLLVFGSEKPSTQLLQRRLHIGYGKAREFIDRMQNEGLIGSTTGKITNEGSR